MNEKEFRHGPISIEQHNKLVSDLGLPESFKAPDPLPAIDKIDLQTLKDARNFILATTTDVPQTGAADAITYYLDTADGPVKIESDGISTIHQIATGLTAEGHRVYYMIGESGLMDDARHLGQTDDTVPQPLTDAEVIASLKDKLTITQRTSDAKTWNMNDMQKQIDTLQAALISNTYLAANPSPIISKDEVDYMLHNFSSGYALPGGFTLTDAPEKTTTEITISVILTALCCGIFSIVATLCITTYITFTFSVDDWMTYRIIALVCAIIGGFAELVSLTSSAPEEDKDNVQP